jgi:CHAD domain-containing protein
VAKARYEPLTPEMPIDQAARAIVRALLAAVVNEAPAVLRNDVKATHDMRVAIRRLRTALATFSSSFPKKRLAAHAGEIRRAARRLGAVRDADVHLAVLRGALGGATEAEMPGVAYAIETLTARRRRALADFAIELSQFDGDAFARLLEDA